MLHLLCCTRSLIWIKHEAVCEEIKEEMILRWNRLFESTIFRDAQDSILGILNEEGRVVVVKVVLLLATFVNHRLWEHSAELHDELKLLLLIVARE